ncbi:hypothetical protein [Pseudactinotalea sp. Z1732]|uniref:hypothetical protein n=1 Tax=Micrococcales TaxID=85006 RepID=UPI003C7D527A
MSQLAVQARQFADELTATIDGVVVGNSQPFDASLVAGGVGVTVRQEPGTGIPLSVDGDTTMSLRVHYRCALDSSEKFLRVEKSTFALHYGAEADGPPIFRYDYDRDMPHPLPRAHLQVDEGATSDISGLFSLAGSGTSRARRVRKRWERDDSHGRQGDLHFPLGGDRFRPSVEDVLEILVDAFGVDCERGWRSVLRRGRVRWRRIQLMAAIRDNAQVAAEVLESEFGYKVIPPAGGHPASKDENLRRL